MRRPTPAVLVGAVLALPLVVVAVRSLVAGHESPSGDVSLIEVRVGDVGTAHNPLLGSYGRYGFNHPGPLWFYALAVPYRLTGNLELGVLAVGVLSIAAIVWVAARRGGLWWAALLTAVLVWGAGPAFVSDPWEPHGLLLPCAALLLLAFDTASGRPWSLPLVAGLASLLAAAQATLLPFAVAMGVVALWRTRERRPLLVAAGVLAVLWLPTLAQQVVGDPPNLTAMWEARHSPVPALGVGGAWDAVAMQLGHRAPWVGFATPLDGLSPTVDLGAAPLVPIGLLAVLAALARRRHVLVVTALVATGAAVVAMSQLLGPVFVWIPQWTRVVGFGCWLAAGWVVLDRLPRPVLAAALGVVSVLSLWDAATFDREDDLVGDAVRTLADRVERGELDEPVLVTSAADADLVFGGGGIGVEVLVLALEGRGIETVVAEDLADHFGPRRARPDRADSHVQLLTVERGGVDPLPPGLRRERTALLRELGLPPDASVGDILRAAQADPSRHDVADRARRIPDLPRLDLYVSAGRG